MPEQLLSHFPYLIAWGIFVLGLGLMARTQHLVKQLIGLYFVQTSLILFYMALSVKRGGMPPILDYHAHTIDPNLYVNPLPHVLMLTAIVVGVATQGVAFMLLRKIFATYKTHDLGKITETYK